MNVDVVLSASGFDELLLVIVATIAATQLFGVAAQRMGQPAVLGELLAGVVLGGSVLGLLDPKDSVIHAFAEIGVLILLFEIGLHTNLRSLAKVGTTALFSGALGVVLPFGGGIIISRLMGIELLPSLVIGAALTATSIGISARVLSDLGQLNSREGQVVIGAAVFDDVVGLIILSVVTGLVAGDTVTSGGVVRIAAVAIGFVVIAVALGSVAVPPIFRIVEKFKVTGTLGIAALAFSFLLAWIATREGSAMIIGAFAAGLVLHPTPQRKEIEKSVTQIGFFFVPLFFASVGASVEIGALLSREALILGGLLILVGVGGKVIAGLSPWWFKGNKLLIGFALVPRGEVGLIFAQLGLASGVLANERFGAVMLMVFVTTLMTPPLLNALVGKSVPDSDASPNLSGVDDLVAGSHKRRDRE